MLLLILQFSCTSRQPLTENLKSETFADVLRRSMQSSKTFAEFSKVGPFEISEEPNTFLPIEAKGGVLADLYLSKHTDPAPLMIFVPSKNSYKEAHSEQGRWASSWGMHALVLQLPDDGEASDHGQSVAKVVRFLYAWPQFLSKSFDINRIILVGHALGGSAVSVALAQKVPVMGAILLDPSISHPKVRKALRSISVPVMLLGADEKISRSKKRSWFRKNISSSYTEFSIAGANTYDAQSPSQISLDYWGMDLTTSSDLQLAFKAALVTSAFSLVQRGDFSFAHKAFSEAVEKGELLLRAHRVSSRSAG